MCNNRVCTHFYSLLYLLEIRKRYRKYTSYLRENQKNPPIFIWKD